ncbi:MAG: hypothetical protein RLZZ29_1672 [Cyanobacteriota bacterium]|jgi:hypothetical protein|uniref:DUF29 domain-containing protein n=1 Tax=Cylindrospermopsis raciborskii TaxID=77022 RepID=UPI001A221F74|nr:DUF29 domain-containing protein [Cylindrospermopsis raciborskii]MBG0742413.1 DUF29 domain-containing protein [Cylindrospermopsis raciborskii KL1]
MPDSSLYISDFLTWLNHQISALKHRNGDILDWDNLAEELTLMGISEKNELKSRLIALLSHLLKWQYQADKRSVSWFTTIANQRDDLQDLLEENPGLGKYIPDLLSKAYRNARRVAAAETGMELAIFPDVCCYKIEQILNPQFICNTTKDFQKAIIDEIN